MIANRNLRCAASIALSIFVLGVLTAPTLAAAPSGGFLVVGNETRNFGDSQECLTFLDADDPSVPLFSVYIGKEPVGGNEFEELESIAVDPATGDVYILAFDSGTTGVNDSAGDTQGDLDLYRVNFASVYDHWSTNFEGQDVRTLPNPRAPIHGADSGGWGNPPTGINNSSNDDYVTYSANNDFFLNTNLAIGHSNTFVLNGAIEKIGQIVRGNSGAFYGYPVTWGGDTLYVLDDSVGASSADNPLDDHSLRIIEKVSDLPGQATITTVMPGGGALDYNNGGYNGDLAQAPVESWESTLITKLNMDGATHSEPRAIAYYDNGAGIRGFWIAEGDFSSTTGQSDKLGFLQLDANDNSLGFRPFVSAGNPFFLPVSDDPAVDPNSNDGKIHEVFVDANGDLVIVESGFGDMADGVHPADQEPGVLRISVNYDNGFGEMEFGAWEPKVFLTFDGGVNTGDKGTDDTGTEFSQHVAFDKDNNKLYFFSPDTGGSFNTDLHVLDLSTGLTESFLNWDDSVSLFGDADTDTVEYFFLSAGLAGDYNEDGIVDAADYVAWRSNPGAFGGAAGYAVWVDNFGATSPGAGGGSGLAAVPEPASVGLLAFGFALLCGCRRRAA